MSVINRMLQDLEARRAGSGGAPAAVRATPGGSDSKRLRWWLAGGAAAAAALALGDWPQLLSAQAARAPQPAAMVEAEVAAAVVTPAADVKSAEAAPAAATLAATTAAATTAATTTAATTTAAATKAAATAGQRGPTRAARPSADAATAAASAPPTTVAVASPGLTPAARSPAAAMLAPAPTGNAAPAEPAPAPARSESVPGRVDKQPSAQSPAQRAAMLYQQALEMAGSGHGRTALERLQQALAIEPMLTAARVQAVSLLLEHGRSAEADATAREGLALVPGEAQLSVLLARSMAGHGDGAGALAVLDRSAKLDADAYGLRAGLLSQQGDFKRALADYEQALRLQPGNSLWWLGLGVALEAQGQPQQARRVYARAQSLGMESHDLNLFVDQKLAALK